MMHGYAADIQPDKRRAHAASVLEGIPGICFIAPTVGFGKDAGLPAVLVSLTTQAATAFATRHIYGLMGPTEPQQLQWECMSLQAARCNNHT